MSRLHRVADLEGPLGDLLEEGGSSVGSEALVRTAPEGAGLQGK